MNNEPKMICPKIFIVGTFIDIEVDFDLFTACLADTVGRTGKGVVFDSRPTHRIHPIDLREFKSTVFEELSAG